MFGHIPEKSASLVSYPERAGEPVLGMGDGKWIFESIFATLKTKLPR